MKTRPTFEQACAAFVHRFTMEHVPAWARRRQPNGCWHAPQFTTDSEWYEATLFDGEHRLASPTHCYTAQCTFPLGHWLDAAFPKGKTTDLACLKRQGKED